MKHWSLVLFGFFFVTWAGWGETPADKALADYFRAETRKIADACLTDVKSLSDWEEQKPKYREQLFEMLGLQPLSPKTDLKPTITGKIERDDFTVEKLHFQSRPGLYVTANFYLPKNVTQPLPTILYLCGHAKMLTNGVSLGNKTGYQHHGIWFARNGYACLVVDTLQLGEVEGLHHGTHNLGMWWWNSRGYTPAGVEAWNNIRALDYLESRPEVDKRRIGVTGRSGGGAYSWTLAALDDRIAVVAPVAGITDLENHVVDGKVEGHCDCMFHVNNYRWDYPLLAALAAPRPLLFCNSDRDRIFPLEGIIRTHKKVRDIYHLHGVTNQLGLLITPGDHEDTQDLQVPVFRWFNRFLKKEEAPISKVATKMFEPAELKVFKELPSDAINASVQETFVPAAPEHSGRDRETLKKELREKVFSGWPAGSPVPKPRLLGTDQKDGFWLSCYEFESQEHVPLRLYLLQKGDRKPKNVRLQVLSAAEWKEWLPQAVAGFPELLKVETGEKVVADAEGYKRWRAGVTRNDEAIAVFAPRGIGMSAWSGDPKKQIHIRRRFMLLGQTLDGMRVWDILAADGTLRLLLGGEEIVVSGDGKREMAVNLLYASLFAPLRPTTVMWPDTTGRQEIPDYLNAARILSPAELVDVVRKSR